MRGVKKAKRAEERRGRAGPEALKVLSKSIFALDLLRIRA